MERDMDLFRQILLEIEKMPNVRNMGILEDQALQIEGRSREKICSHLLMLNDAGYVELQPNPIRGSVHPLRLTNAGHDFIDAARDDGIWGKVTDQLAKVGGSAALSVFQTALNALVTAAMSRDG